MMFGRRFLNPDVLNSFIGTIPFAPRHCVHATHVYPGAAAIFFIGEIL
jgi:hypothetical protein